jgi:hypothetical protein
VRSPHEVTDGEHSGHREHGGHRGQR